MLRRLSITNYLLIESLELELSKGRSIRTGETASGIEVLGKAVVQQDPQAEMVSAYRRKLSMMLN